MGENSNTIDHTTYSTEELRTLIERRHKVRWWGRDRMITPRLVDEVLGDGRQLIYVMPIMHRPNYYVARVDSNFSLSNYSEDGPDCPSEWIEDLWDLIEEQFGRRKYANDRFPMVDEFYDGCCWGPIGLEEFLERKNRS
jgi:hypothetical protein